MTKRVSFAFLCHSLAKWKNVKVARAKTMFCKTNVKKWHKSFVIRSICLFAFNHFRHSHFLVSLCLYRFLDMIRLHLPLKSFRSHFRSIYSFCHSKKLTILRNQLIDIHLIFQMFVEHRGLSTVLPYVHKILKYSQNQDLQRTKEMSFNQKMQNQSKNLLDATSWI